jgi:PAS domain S-box-containing protein
MVEERTNEIRKLSDAVHASKDSIVISDPDGKITDVNEATLKMYGTDDKSELIGKSSFDFIAPEDREKAAAGMKEVMERGYSKDRKYQIIIKDGSRIPVEMSASAMKGTNGELIGFVGISRDITERKRAEKKFRETRDYLEKLINYANSPIIVWDPKFKITRFNQAFEHLTGYRADEVIGQELNILFPEASMEESLRKIKCTLSGEFWETVEIPIISRDRDIRIVLWNSANIYDEDGTTLLATVAQGHDITERKMVEEALLISKRELDARNRISETFLTIPDEKIYSEVLKLILNAMKSKYGIFGYINEQGILIIPSITGDIWDMCQVTDKTIEFPPETWTGIWGRALREKKILYANEGSSVPVGHVPVVKVLVVPIIFHGKVIGLIEVANKETDYDEKDKKFIENIANHIAPILNARLQSDMQEKNRQHAEKALKKSEERYRSLVENINFGITLIDQDFRIIMTNTQISRWFNKPAHELVGKHCFKEFEKHQEVCSYCPGVKAMAAGHPAQVETRGVRDNGSSFPVKVHAFPVFEADGAVCGFIEIIEDTTEHKRAEEALKKLSSAVEQGADSVIITDKHGVIDYVNPAFEELTGYAREEAVGKKPGILKSGEHDKKFYKELHETIHSGRIYRGEIINRKKNGEIYFVASTITPITDMQGNITHFVTTEKDITERKIAEEQLKASLKEKEILLQEIHHRVKNNMQVISSMLSLQSEYITEKKYRDMFEESQNRISSMALIHEKLYQSRDFAKIDLSQYIKDLVNYLFRYYGINTGNIALNLNIENVYIGIDSGIPCGLIINELVTNSLKHAFPDGRKGEMKISLRSIDANMIELAVSDNGTGIPEDLDFRNTKSLGLHLVTMLAENQLHGEIHLDRSKGTEFKIKFKGGK